MTEENKQPSTGEPEAPKLKMITVGLQDIIKLEVSGLFLQRVHGLLVTMCDEVGQKETIKIYERLAKDEAPQTSHEEAIRIFTALIDGIETAAREQGLAKEVEVGPEEALQMLEFLNIKDDPTPPPSSGS